MQIEIGLNQEALSEWEEYREDKKKPLSRLAKKKVINRLLKHDPETQQAMVDRCIENDWVGLHDMPQDKQNSTRQADIYQELTDTSWAH